MREQEQGAREEAAPERGADAATPGRTSAANDLSPGAAAGTGGGSVFSASGGDPLPYRQKSLLENSLGKDLSGVRVHHGDGAAAKADAVNARAYAQGNSIFFNKGEYQPDNPKKDALLAHE